MRPCRWSADEVHGFATGFVATGVGWGVFGATGAVALSIFAGFFVVVLLGTLWFGRPR